MEPQLAPFGPSPNPETLAERYARQTELLAQTARALAEAQDGSELARLRKELAELRAHSAWQEKRIKHLETPWLLRGLRRVFKT